VRSIAVGLPTLPAVSQRQVPQDLARSAGSLGFTVQVGELTTQRFVALLAKLDVYRAYGIPALYQPITLLWAFSRASRSEPRMVGWKETGRSVRDLIERFGRLGERSNVYYPVAALHRAGLWELDAGPRTVPSAHGSSVPQRWFDEHQPRGGLATSVYELVRDSVRARDAAVDALVDAYFVDADPGELLDELGLLKEPDVPEVNTAEMAFADRTARYKDLCERADIYWSGVRGNRYEATLSARLPFGGHEGGGPGAQLRAVREPALHRRHRRRDGQRSRDPRSRSRPRSGQGRAGQSGSDDCPVPQLPRD
jgi:hypothetical protein